MKNPEAKVSLADTSVHRVLPTHELSARQRRKQAVRLNPETKPETAQARKSGPGALEPLFRQFPPQMPPG